MLETVERKGTAARTLMKGRVQLTMSAMLAQVCQRIKVSFASSQELVESPAESGAELFWIILHLPRPGSFSMRRSKMTAKKGMRFVDCIRAAHAAGGDLAREVGINKGGIKFS